MDNRKKGVLCIVIATVLLSCGGVLIKSVDASSMTIAAVRGGIAGIVFIPFIQWKKLRFDRSFVGLILAYSFLTATFVTATKMTTAANAIILQCTAPLWLYLFYLVSGKKSIVLSELIPRLVILCGILVILFDPTNAGGGQAVFGNLLALASGIAYAVEQYLMEKDYPMNDLSKVGIINLIMALGMLLLFNHQIDILNISWSNWLVLIFLGVVQLGGAYLFLFKGVRLVSAFEASIISLLEPILNPILVFFIIGEKPTGFTILGFAAILVGILLTLRPEKYQAGVN